jgi:Baseplate J-like protein
MATKIPLPTFGVTGLTIPAELAILAGVRADQQAAFGGNLNPSLTTPQGQLAQSLTAIIGDKNNQFLALANSVDPAFASGRMQDAIGRIYYLTRIAAASTVVTTTCMGKVGVIIPVGSKAVDQAGNIYLCTQTGTIPSGGSINLTFSCVTTGAISCPIGYLNKIYQSITGWDSITNAAAGVAGNAVESRADFEFRRYQSVAINSNGTLAAILGAVLNVPGVLDAYAYQNNTSASITFNGQTLVANSIYIAAYGGNAQLIANAIYSKKSNGCAMNGSTSMTVTDTGNGLYVTPYPTYTILFQVPVAVPILFSILMQTNAGAPANATALIQNAVVQSFRGVDGGARARIGNTLFASRFYANIAALGAWAMIYEIKLGITTATLDSVLIPINQIPTVSNSNISVTFS